MIPLSRLVSVVLATGTLSAAASGLGAIPQLSLPITEFLADAELSLPISPCMTTEQMEYVVECINNFK